MSDVPRLGRASWLAGLQCARRLWLCVRAPHVAGPADADAADRKATGRTLALRARALFPGGVAVAGDGAVAATRALVAAPDVPAVFDAAFEHAGVAVRVDVLERLAGGGFGLRDVTPRTRVRPEHLEDVALQRAVVAACGVDVRSAEVVLVDREYVRGPGEVDWPRFFRRQDVTAETAPLAADAGARRDAFAATLARPDAPAVEPSPHCFSPRRCEFWTHCTAGRPDDWIMRLPRLYRNHHAALREAGIARIADVPDGWWLTGPQARARAAVLGGRVVATDGLAAALRAAGPPASYLDFEGAAPAVPILVGTRPYETIPFQWSLHRDDGAHATHAAFLADGPRDPRPAFLESLLAATAGSDEPVLVYSPYESQVLAALAEAFPRHAAALDALRARLVDLLDVILAHVYHPAFAGSFSLKQVAPALVEGFAWDDAGGVTHGTAASRAFEALWTGRVTGAEAAALRAALLAYCATDTRALMEVHRALRRLAAAAR